MHHLSLTCRTLVMTESLYGIAPPFFGPPRAFNTLAMPCTLKIKQNLI
jgi:hypothetical protein